MENFIVSARKYRPVTFDTVIGQNSITGTLKNAIKNNHLAQAFLFCGPRGVGKTTCARILAKTINCEHLNSNIETCNKCTPCLSFDSSSSFNVFELDAASNNSVDDIRNLVDQVRIPPQNGKYKVYIIDEVHMLSSNAFNAFLKTLEEPPPYAKFILATTEKHKIIPTILSRCQIYDFARITVDDIAKHLEFVAKSEGIKTEPDALHIIAQKADGALRDALSIFDQLVSFEGNELTYKQVIENLNVLDTDNYFRITDNILAGDTSSTLLMADEILENGFEGLYFLIGLGEHFRNLLVSKDISTLKLLQVSTNLKDHFKEQALRCSSDFLLRNIDIISKTDTIYKTSSNKRLQLELALLQMCANPESHSKTQVDFLPEKIKQKTETAEKSVVYNIQEPVKSIAVPQKTKPITDDSKNKTPASPAAMQGRQKNKIQYKQETISIRDQPKPVTEKKNISLVSEPPQDYDLHSKTFTQTDLQKYWNEYAEKMAGDHPSFSSTLHKGNPSLKENNVVEMTIETIVQEEEMNTQKADLLDFLRQKLENSTVQLSIIISKTEEEIRPYTAKEKYKKMAEKNPSIHQLKQSLDLELDI